MQGFYAHESATCARPMRFSVFVPPQARRGPVPVLYYLAGPHLHRRDLHDQGRRAAARRRARPHARRARHQPARSRVCPATTRAGTSGSARASTSTRPQAPWSAHYRMYSYVTQRAAGARRRDTFPSTARIARASSAIRWAGTARWSARCAIPSATGRSRRSRRSRRRCACPWGRRPSRAISGADRSDVGRLRRERARRTRRVSLDRS